MSILYLILWYDFAVWWGPIAMISGNIEMNLGLKPNSAQSFSICHKAFTNISLRTAYILVRKLILFVFLRHNLTQKHFQMIETQKYLTVLYFWHTNLSTIRERVFVSFFRATLLLRVFVISCLSKCIAFKLSIDIKVCRFTHLDRSTSLTQVTFKIKIKFCQK